METLLLIALIQVGCLNALLPGGAQWTKPDLLGECGTTCTYEHRPVCASNGKTYANKCEFEIAECKAKLNGVTLTEIHPCNPSKHWEIPEDEEEEDEAEEDEEGENEEEKDEEEEDEEEKDEEEEGEEDKEEEGIYMEY